MKKKNYRTIKIYHLLLSAIFIVVCSTILFFASFSLSIHLNFSNLSTGNNKHLTSCTNESDFSNLQSKDITFQLINDKIFAVFLHNPAVESYHISFGKFSWWQQSPNSDFAFVELPFQNDISTDNTVFIARGYNFQNEQIVEISKAFPHTKPLDSPIIESFLNNVLSWSPVENASLYVLKTNDMILASTTNTSFNLSDSFCSSQLQTLSIIACPVGEVTMFSCSTPTTFVFSPTQFADAPYNIFQCQINSANIVSWAHSPSNVEFLLAINPKDIFDHSLYFSTTNNWFEFDSAMKGNQLYIIAKDKNGNFSLPVSVTLQ